MDSEIQRVFHEIKEYKEFFIDQEYKEFFMDSGIKRVFHGFRNTKSFSWIQE